ncbi:MAG: hypothetical protein M1828_001484 [Chrysothrix sp. TS-e1954]|nr:MAG: hypothetical protein M1828_001484 [Chrysothrix sp. TS-e1954]
MDMKAAEHRIFHIFKFIVGEPCIEDYTLTTSRKENMNPTPCYCVEIWRLYRDVKGAEHQKRELIYRSSKRDYPTREAGLTDVLRWTELRVAAIQEEHHGTERPRYTNPPPFQSPASSRANSQADPAPVDTSQRDARAATTITQALPAGLAAPASTHDDGSSTAEKTTPAKNKAATRTSAENKRKAEDDGRAKNEVKRPAPAAKAKGLITRSKTNPLRTIQTRRMTNGQVPQGVDTTVLENGNKEDDEDDENDENDDNDEDDENDEEEEEDESYKEDKNDMSDESDESDENVKKSGKNGFKKPAPAIKTNGAKTKSPITPSKSNKDKTIRLHLNNAAKASKAVDNTDQENEDDPDERRRRSSQPPEPDQMIREDPPEDANAGEIEDQEPVVKGKGGARKPISSVAERVRRNTRGSLRK